MAYPRLVLSFKFEVKLEIDDVLSFTKITDKKILSWF